MLCRADNPRLGGKEALVEPTQKKYRAGHWVVWGTLLGAFIGLLLGKFALGLIFGFFVGIMIDSAKRKGAPSSPASDPNPDTRT
jgi:hypothetical protein